MSSKYPCGKDYEVMYKRFFSRPVTDLIDLVKLAPYSRVLDLCGGTGRLSLEMHKRGHHVTYIDESKDMACLDEIRLSGNMFILHERAGIYLYCYPRDAEKYDAVFCQQAINYWFHPLEVDKIVGVINPGGYFVFNTFRDKPSTVPVVKEYDIDGRHYVEVYYSIGDKVHHVQVCEGYDVHTTEFNYISHEIFMTSLLPYFDIDLTTKDKTMIYKCKKK